MGHYEHWREDLKLASDLKMQAIRWGVPWYRVEHLPGEFDWSWTDQVIPYMVEELGITPIIDLMHYGCPFWLRREFASDEYPAAVAAYAGAFASRYKHLVKWYTPLNEPIVNASMCGRRGQWPPYLRGDRGYVRIALQLAKGIIATVEAIKSIQPEAIMVHVDASGLIRAARTDLIPLAVEDQHQLFLMYDLLTGRVTSDHPLFSWLVRNGASLIDLAALKQNAIGLDMMGLNFYPQWSTRRLYLNSRGLAVRGATEREGQGFGEMISTYYKRYHTPIIVTETSAFGSDSMRAMWLDAGMAAIKHLRQSGLPVLGYTWFPLFTMIDWRYRLGQKPAADYRLELGLYKLGEAGGPRWIPTALVPRLVAYRSDPEAAIGTLAVASPMGQASASREAVT
jgi:beta-glucosidase/6-phospho-beta-glucosidase/beta-galactosidase